jgi:hypothetical protein
VLTHEDHAMCWLLINFLNNHILGATFSKGRWWCIDIFEQKNKFFSINNISVSMPCLLCVFEMPLIQIVFSQTLH